ncbi:GNAT family N-acetyltransferase [Streptococcus parasuis]|uniref:GNAT family N-acetyltransferase n=1 Tax=Streptococcus parasuis TaxID=1501662 RepID=UPI0028AA75E5|nr:GNAT family N-acetyltransferase [Streptococcus parasuis]
MKKKSFKTNNEIIIQKTCDYDEIYRALLDISSAYTPPLITSINNLSEYALKLVDNAEVFIAKDESILGFIAVYSNDMSNKTGYITQVGVKSIAQSTGIGKRLMNEAYSICKEKGMQKIKLEVRKSNIKAIKFYQKEGFKDCGDATEHSTYMEKTL